MGARPSSGAGKEPGWAFPGLRVICREMTLMEELAMLNLQALGSQLPYEIGYYSHFNNGETEAREKL